MSAKCIVYRMGGPSRPIWKRTLPVGNPELVRADIEQMGYKAMIEDYETSLAVGLPEGWDYQGRGANNFRFESTPYSTIVPLHHRRSIA